ncbi:MAG TPA: hypothetical protein VEC06_02050 [Paucimonas sp.]|nr:hypothetical protein [Paucimonas sp.]
MIVKREDLVAAAHAGVLHYKEVDSLLIFLAQREMTAKKADEQQQSLRGRRAWLMYYLAGMLAIGVATLCSYLFVSKAMLSLGAFAALWFTLIYALSAMGAAAWLGWRRGGVVRGMFSVFLIALMPLAILLAQEMMQFMV